MDRDVGLLMATLGQINEQQFDLFYVLQQVIAGHKPNDLCRLTDTDVGLATGALASSLETAGRGVIYEQTTASAADEGLRRALKAIVDEIVGRGGSRAERDLALVLRGIERGARHELAAVGDTATSYLELVERVFGQPGSPGFEPPKKSIVMP